MSRWPARQQVLAVLAALVCTGAAAQPAPPARPAPAAIKDVPFITTPDHVTVAMLELAGVGPRDHVIDLGSGDGRIVITAARRFGATGLGVEIVPDLVAQSRDSARRAGVEGRTRFEVQDLFATDLAPASVITMYLLPEVNLALRPRLLALAPGTRIVSHDWDLGDWAPDRTLTLAVPQKTIGREKLSRLHLWTVPARVAGLWCAAGGTTLELEQRFQTVQATLRSVDDVRSYSGRVDGRSLRLLGGGGSAWSLRAEADGLRAVHAGPGSAGSAGSPAVPAATAWRRATGATCS